jgi:Fe-Mn family superoxide dismutase
MKHSLPNLPYAYNDLEPYIDAQTMEIHHSKHHQAYVNNLNLALEKHPELSDQPLEDLIKNLSALPDDIRDAIRNHGGGHLNHSFFWQVMVPIIISVDGEEKPKLPTENYYPLEPFFINNPDGEVANLINKNFQSFANLKELFTKSATSHFGSGWTWLSIDSDGGLKIHSTANQDSPLSDGLKPLLCIDLWEHAYYLKYQNRRAEYINAWWNVVNWSKVAENMK